MKILEHKSVATDDIEARIQEQVLLRKLALLEKEHDENDLMYSYFSMKSSKQVI